MPRNLELAAVAAVRKALPDAEIHQRTPVWLMRPGRGECEDRWELITSIYRLLTGLDLPQTMPPRERRQVDAVIKRPGHPPRIFEFDESQHFNVHRAAALRAYPDDVATAFPRDGWLRASEKSTKEAWNNGRVGEGQATAVSRAGRSPSSACVSRRAR